VSDPGGGSEPSRQDRARALLRELWLRNRSTTLERLAVVGSALRALAGGALDPETRLTALGEAHKLRGILGTYGFDEGSVLAERAEYALEGADSSDAESAGDLADTLADYARTLEHQ
jgi:chemotaxis protein histidine kinase CheA